MDDWNNLYGSIRGLEKPVIAALNGVAAGSGFQVALLCDIRIGHPGIKMGQTEIDAGIPSVTGTWAMMPMLGLSRTVELVLTGRLMDAEECHRAGLLHHLVPQAEVQAKALEVAQLLAAKPRVAMQLNKRRLRQLTEPSWLEAEEAARAIHRQAFDSGEPKEAMARFFEERAARKLAAAH
jgi:enoyl-CoA hydratase/carnithine racemase